MLLMFGPSTLCTDHWFVLARVSLQSTLHVYTLASWKLYFVVSITDAQPPTTRKWSRGGFGLEKYSAFFKLIASYYSVSATTSLINSKQMPLKC